MTYNGINFNGTNGTGYGLKWWCNFNTSNYWLANRLLVCVQVTVTLGDTEGLYLNTTSLGWVEYALDSNKYCIIDLTDVLRTYQGEVIYIGVGQKPVPADDLETIVNALASGLIDPAGVIIPPHALSRMTITPPDTLIGFSSTGSVYLYFETRGGTTPKIQADNGPQIALTQPSQNVNANTMSYFVITEGAAGSTQSKRYNILKPDCGKRYAVVRWQSFTGATRTHVFEVTKVKTETDGAYSLLDLENQYTEIKGRKDGFTLRLDGLTAYDIWYYSDVCQSSKVEISLDGTSFVRVGISTKSVTLPDGETGENGKLEIAVNWKVYDAVTM